MQVWEVNLSRYCCLNGQKKKKHTTNIHVPLLSLQLHNEELANFEKLLYILMSWKFRSIWVMTDSKHVNICLWNICHSIVRSLS